MTLALLVMVLYQMLRKRVNQALSATPPSELNLETVHYLHNVPEMLQLLNGKLPRERLLKKAYQPKYYGVQLLLRNSIFEYLDLELK